MHSRSFAAACAAALLLNATPASAAYPERMLTMTHAPAAAMTCWPASLARRWANCLARPSWW